MFKKINLNTNASSIAIMRISITLAALTLFAMPLFLTSCSNDNSTQVDNQQEEILSTPTWAKKPCPVEAYNSSSVIFSNGNISYNLGFGNTWVDGSHLIEDIRVFFVFYDAYGNTTGVYKASPISIDSTVSLIGNIADTNNDSFGCDVYVYAVAMSDGATWGDPNLSEEEIVTYGHLLTNLDVKNY